MKNTTLQQLETDVNNMRIDSCRCCGFALSVKKYCGVCSQPIHLQCDNCSTFSDDPIHLICQMPRASAA